MQPGRRGLKASLAVVAAAVVVVAVALVVVTRDNDRGVEVSTASRGGPPPAGGEPIEPTTVPPTTTPSVTAESSSSSTTTSGPASTSTTRRPTTTTTTAPAVIPTTTTTTRPGWEEVNAADESGIYLAGPDGHSLHRLAQDGQVGTWSPDGRHLSYLRGGEIWVVDGDGASRKVADGFSDAWVLPSWSPDSRHLAYPGPPAGAERQRDIWIADATGVEPPFALPAPGDDAAVAWGPDGRIASASPLGLAIADADGSHRTLVWSTSQLGSPGPIYWSPDGSTLAIFPTATGYWVVVGADGSNPRSSTDRPDPLGVYTIPLAGGPWSVIPLNQHATLSPAGDRVAAPSTDTGGRLASIDVMARDGSARRAVATLPSGAVWDGLDWSPSGTWLAFGVGILPTPALGS